MDSRWLKIFTLLTVVLAGCGHVPTHELGDEQARKATPTKVPDTAFIRDFHSWLEQLAQKEEFSGAMLLAKDDQILFQHAYGFADRAANVPNKVDTKFYLASVSKVFTSLAILQLAQAGKFSLDDKLISVLPEYPNKEVASKVTIRQLLMHTSGLGNFFERFVQLDFRQHQTPESILPVFANDPLQFEPGTKISYSNAGYLILGLIVTRASSQSYEDYLQEHIFEPARMTNSGCSTEETRGLNAIGGAHSTVEDLFRFSLALQNHKLLDKQHTDFELTGGAGMTAERINGVRIAGHIGGAPGMSTSFELYPEIRYTVVILSTTDGAAITVRDRLRRELTRR
jgi:CubicO group peptidase (beta-lactamase class C family)